MVLTFRWYAEADPVSLDRIRQIPGLRGIVAALYDLRPGEAWPVYRVADLRSKIEAAGLDWRVIESIPVHEEIKYGGQERDARIEAWIESARSVAEVLGPRSPSGSEEPIVITYNFMPVFDWTRSDLHKLLPDGSKALAYDEEVVARMDPLEGDLELPGWLAHYSRSELFRLLHRWREIGAEELWSNFAYFLKAVVPVVEELGMRLALHPDDPPWPIFGIPRIIVDAAAVRRLLAVADSPANSICLCSGSLGVLPGNDLVAMAKEFSERIAFVHLRNVKVTGPRSFQESAHWAAAGSLDLPGIVRALLGQGYSGPFRPDHGRMIWGEEGRPGYGLHDRALGSQYLLGLVDATRLSMRA
jgi:mannonate dehydratase